jgi:hypothetical protein
MAHLTVASIAQPHTTTLAKPIEAHIASFDLESSNPATVHPNTCHAATPYPLRCNTLPVTL